MGEAIVRSIERNVEDDITFTEVIVDSGDEDHSTCDHYSSPGDDAPPLPGDLAATIDGTGSGCENAVGYIDPINAPQAEPGEKRIYSRAPDGTLIAEIWLKGDGSIEIVGPLGSIKMDATGAITILGPTVELGEAGGGFVALASKVDLELAKIGVAITSLGGSYTPGSGSPPGTIPAVTGATKVKAV